MYRPMLASTAISESSVMSLTSGTNRWASRVVIVLQLAAWSAVGIILLQKGVISLQYGPPNPKNVTQIFHTTETTAIFQASRPFGSDGNVNHVQEEEKPNKIPRRIVKSTDASRKFGGNPEENPKSKGISVEESGEISFAELIESRKRSRKNAKVNSTACKNDTRKTDKDSTPKKRMLKVNRAKEDNESKRNERLISDVTSNENSNNVIKCVNGTSDSRTKKNEDVENAEDMENISKDSTVAQTLVTENSRDSVESRGGKRLRLSRLSGGGAAAAIAMVAVGAVMLVLGPAVIILRALDERRQERRFLKLSTRDDLPPSYEQATLMDEAPRYSTLSLNAVLAQDQPSSSLSSSSSSSSSSTSSFTSPPTNAKYTRATQPA